MTVHELGQLLEAWAPPSLAADYDNVGLLVGNAQAAITGTLLTLDVTEAVLDEALAHGCNVIVAHHPVWFGKRTSLTDGDWVGRLIRQAIRQDINLYAIHTNLDHLADGVSAEMASRLGLQDAQVLDPLPDTLRRLTVYCPPDAVQRMEQALFQAGAGKVGPYDQASIQHPVQTAFRPLTGAQPAQGQVGQREVGEEVALQVLFPAHRERTILGAMAQAHPYEQPAYQVDRHGAANTAFGAGLLGMLAQPMPKPEFLAHVARVFGCQAIRYADAALLDVRRVAVCGGSGSFLLAAARRAKADAFVTADITYHKFFDSEGELLYCDIGHWETEQFTPDLLHRWLTERLPAAKLHRSQVRTNPMQVWTAGGFCAV